MIKIVNITDSELKGQICESILRSLPLWFGIESAIVDYIKDTKAMKTWVAYEGELAVGFATTHYHSAASAEIHVLGILAKFHRQGIGRQLLNVVEGDLRHEGVKFLSVKTLSESRVNEEYARTRAFYLSVGFTPLQEFKTLWGKENPCLLLVKAL